MSLRLRLLGGPALEQDGSPITGRSTQRRRLALLGLLAEARETGLSRDKLLAYLWPERDTELGRHSLSQTLHAIRKDLGTQVLLTGIDEVRLNPAALTCDLWEFEDARQVGDLRRAAAAYTGPFLDGFFIDEAPEFERWAEGERQRLARIYGDMLEELAREASSAGSLVEASRVWHQRAELDPLDSRVAVALMTALAAEGNRAGAIHYARFHASLLSQEMGVGPNAAVAALAQRLAAETGTAPVETVAPDSPVAIQRTGLQAALGSGYRLDRELGSGGMATVYLAEDLRHQRQVAVKVLKPEVGAALGTDWFLGEIGIAARLHHPHILPLFDSGTFSENGNSSGFYYVTPFVRGESLRHRLRLRAQLPVDEAIRITCEAAAALAHAHEHGIVHRDIKPENILLQDGSVLVADFGLAGAINVAAGEQSPAPSLAIGTPQYMSPEQSAATGALDPRSDIYALGCVLYEMLAGEPPFRGPTAQATLTRHAVDPVPPLRTFRPAVSAALEEVVAKALAKAPAERFATAGEFAAALAAVGSATTGAERSASRVPAWVLAGAVAVVLAVAGGAWRVRYLLSPPLIPSATAIAVLPFTPSVADTGLTRLGRDLVLTLSASLDGVGDIRVVDPHTVLVQVPDRETRAGLESGIALGRRFGAGSVVSGSLVRVGPNVRLDASLFPTDGAADTLLPLARASVTTAPDSIVALTNSITRALLRQVWQHGRPPTPSIEAALQTRSVPALRAFLEGERAMVQGKFVDATRAYERTIRADSTFWLAYARHGAARKWAGNQEPDSVIAAAAWAHRAELPEPDRLAIELWRLGWGGDSVSAALALSQQITQRFPDNWLGWMDRADLLVHLGPHLGLTRLEAIDALERTVELAPDFVYGWEHLVWMYLQEHDSGGTARALAALTRLGAGEALSESCFGCDYLQQFRLLVQSDRRDDLAYHALVDSVGQDVARHWWALPVEPFWYGLQQPQIDVNRRVLRLRRSPYDWGFEYRMVQAWAARGAWDSAIVAMAEYTPGASDSTFAMRNYQLVAAGVLVGALDPAEAVRFARAAWSATAIIPSQRPDIAWLNGVLAARRGDRPGLSAARAVLQHAGPDAALLSRSLAAFDLALEGDTRRAGQALAALEWALAERPLFGAPRELELMSLDRLAASRWLLATGDTAQAARLLTWPEAYDLSRMAVVLAPLVYLERARIEDAQGRVELARAHYEQFLRRYDMPTARHRYLVREATLALARLSGLTSTNAEPRP